MYKVGLAATALLVMATSHAKESGWTEAKSAPAEKRPGLSETAARLATSEAPKGAPAPLSRQAERSLERVYTDPGDLPQLETEVDGKTVKLPLKHTHVQAEVVGYVAEVEVTQTYENPFEQPLEAIYVFPLPENSAVSAMKMVIGERIIEADIQKRAEARRTYETAKREGHTAALLEQERPNVFTQSVANIEPKKSIDVVITYAQTLTYDAGEYEFVFPMVVGPRFMPGEALPTKQGSGGSPDTTEVPDASRISPPVLGAGMRTGHDISLELVAEAGLPITTWEVPTHDVESAPTYDGTLALRLGSEDKIPNRDFVLRYRVDGDEPEAAVLPHKSGDDGYFTLVVQPPKLDVDALVGKREIIFVVDISGSMSGVPLGMCQDAMEHALGSLRPVDTFNILTFAGATAWSFEAPRPANDTNVKEGLAFIRKMQAGGGTYMLDAIKEALKTDVEAGRHRYVFFMTDGYVGNEAQILEATKSYVSGLSRRGHRARVFGFGVGSSVNRMLLDGLGKQGKGLTVYATTREDPTVAVNKFFRLIDHSLLEDVRIDWGGLDVIETYPKTIPDLFASRPLVVHGRYKKAGKGTITIRGWKGEKRLELPLEVSLPERDGERQMMGKLWARAKIDDLERDLWAGEKTQTVDAITKLGLDFHLVTAYTSLVAVDRSKRVSGELLSMVQPVEVPEGVDAGMAGAYGIPAAQPSPAPSYGGRAGYGGGAAAEESPRRAYSTTPAPVGSYDRAEKRAKEPEMVDKPKMEPKAPPKSDLIPPKDVREHSRELSVSGGLGHAEVQAVLAQKRAELARELGGKRGKVQLRFYVDTSGKVLQLKALSSSFDDATTRRIVELVKRWSFPKAAGTATVVWTLTL